MAKFEKGRQKTGGRKKGTPNKTPKVVKEKFLEEICDYVESGSFHADMVDETVSPIERLNIVAKLANYILPKQSSVDSKVNVTSEEQQSVLDRLSQLAKENE